MTPRRSGSASVSCSWPCSPPIAVASPPCARSRRGLVLVTVVALDLILLLSPPLQLNDVFNYLGYAQLGALHQLNPYTHVIAQEPFDPVYRFASWHNLRSPYGPLFTRAHLSAGLAAAPVAYWVLKLVTVLVSLAFIALVWRCARQLGRDPRFAVVFVALNPIYLVYAVGGFHNDFFMLVPTMGAISLLLAGRDRAAGAVLMLAVAVKFTAVLLLPVPAGRRRHPAARSCESGRRRRWAPCRWSRSAWPCSASRSPTWPSRARCSPTSASPTWSGCLLGAGGGAPWLLKAADVVSWWSSSSSSTAGATGWPAPAGRRSRCSPAWPG